MARSEVPNGDQIAKQVTAKTNDNFVDIARELTDAHNHRPGLYNQDLAKVNEAMHAKGLLPGVDIVGVNGQDFVAKKADGSVSYIDATDLSRTHDAKALGTSDINGRKATLNADGSGTVEVKAGDSAWTISRDVLKQQGVANPTDNQIANYTKELTQANGKSTMDHLRPGMEPLKLPPASKDSFDTQFTNDRADAAQNKDIAAINDNFAAAKDALSRTNFYGIDFQGISKERLQGMLTTMTDLTDNQKKGLNFLVANYSQFEQHVTGRPGTTQDRSWFDSALLDKRQADEIRQAQLDAFQMRKDG